ncbi:MAG TPA: ABC transporter ATP-binding protein [Candidatus Acidoferrales bacterium]|nr:ABC transporter ATP-binding protein [Candidatus Acidoferrales bacterium]
MLCVEELHVAYGSVKALRGVTLEVPERRIVAILGANGAGKSTLLKAISGVLNGVRGRISFEGRPILHLDPAQIVRAGLIHCPEGRQVFPDLSVLENLRMGAYARGEPHDVAEQLALFPVLEQRQRQAAGTLSGGEQQMLAIARALMARPRLLMLDEPSLGLAPIIVERIFDVIVKLRESGMAILLVEQNAELALRFADRAYVIGNGAIRTEGRPEDVLRSEALREAYLG